MTSESTTFRASCHCGAITVTVPRLPDHINHCQCTICRRYGAAWGYYNIDEVKIETKPDAVTKQYVWGDRDTAFNFCDTCGCVMYWWPHRSPATDERSPKMGLNTSNMNPEVLRYVNRKYDYECLKLPLRSKDTAHQDDLAEY